MIEITEIASKHFYNQNKLLFLYQDKKVLIYLDKEYVKSI